MGESCGGPLALIVGKQNRITYSAGTAPCRRNTPAKVAAVRARNEKQEVAPYFWDRLRLNLNCDWNGRTVSLQKRICSRPRFLSKASNKRICSTYMKGPGTFRCLSKRTVFYLFQKLRELQKPLRKELVLPIRPRDLQKLRREDFFYLYEEARDLSKVMQGKMFCLHQWQKQPFTDVHNTAV